MPNFKYKASDITGKIFQGTLDAPEESMAVMKLQEMGYIPIRITPEARTSFSFFNGSIRLGAILQRIGTRDLMLFTQDIASLISAGLPVDKALKILGEVAEKERMRQVVKELLRSVEGGAYLSDAMAKHPYAFSEFYISMVRAGEAGGVLVSVFERLGQYLENKQDLIEYIVSVMVYPLFLSFVGGLSIIILLTYVIPKFAMIFIDMGKALPRSTQFLIDMSSVFKLYWWVGLIGVAIVYITSQRLLAVPSIRFKMDRFKLKLPLWGSLEIKTQVAGFARTFGTLIKSGVPMLQALLLVKDIIANKAISNAMGDVHQRVKEGERLSQALLSTRLFPTLAVQMITVGEESGRLEEMLLRVADNYEKIVKSALKRLVSLIEPAMILLMGGVVAFIVISMLMAIFSMNDISF